MNVCSASLESLRTVQHFAETKILPEFTRESRRILIGSNLKFGEPKVSINEKNILQCSQIKNFVNKINSQK